MEEIDHPENWFVASSHGHMRRELRNISENDLIAAKKYGTKERSDGYLPQHKSRWKFNFADIVFITGDDERTEVTSYVTPLFIPKAVISTLDFEAHEALTNKIKLEAKMATSHIVFVIDQSASMRTCDADNYRTRSDAVFASIALDFIAKLIDNEKVTNVITLIEMRNEADIAFEREPCTKVLYDKIFDRKRNARQLGQCMIRRAMRKVLKVFSKEQQNKGTNLTLIFISDEKKIRFIRRKAL